MGNANLKITLLSLPTVRSFINFKKVCKDKIFKWFEEALKKFDKYHLVISYCFKFVQTTQNNLL